MTDRKPRADAAGNRARIVDAARTLLNSTSDLPMNAVAKAAGLGQGTLYRNFATREALLVEVYRADVDELVAAAAPLLADHDAATAFRLWLARVVDYAQVKRGVLAALDPGAGRELTTAHTAPIRGAIDLLLREGKRQGSIRDDVSSAEVLILLGFLSRISDEDSARHAHHILDLILGGLLARER